jgi:gluconolactonase
VSHDLPIEIGCAARDKQIPKMLMLNEIIGWIEPDEALLDGETDIDMPRHGIPQLQQIGIARRLVDAGMEFDIEPVDEKLVDRPSHGGALPRQRIFEPREHGRVAPQHGTGLMHRKPFDGEPRFADMADLLFVEGGDTPPAPRFMDQDALAFQHAKRLPQRDARNSEIIGKIGLDQPLPVWNAACSDALHQLIGDPFGKRCCFEPLHHGLALTGLDGVAVKTHGRIAAPAVGNEPLDDAEYRDIVYKPRIIASAFPRGIRKLPEPDVSAVTPPPAARVFFDGLAASPRLAHPEGVAVAPDGAVWCGTENGQFIRIDPEGGKLENRGETGGFLLGLAFDAGGAVFACDFLKACIWKLPHGSNQPEVFATGPKIPNYPVVDLERGCLYVSDSNAFGVEGPGIWRFDLLTGAGGLWCDHAFTFANGMALTPDGDNLMVVETFAGRVSRVPILSDGSAGTVTPHVTGIERLPDGLAYDAEGRLHISCYEPSRVYRLSHEGRLEILLDDPLAHLMCHPTNIAFRGATLFTANLGRWHITAIETDAPGLPLPLRI